jgi:hypothetical protein
MFDTITRCNVGDFDSMLEIGTASGHNLDLYELLNLNVGGKSYSMT